MRLPFGFVLHRTKSLEDGIYSDLGQWYERGVLHAEAHLGRRVCDCRNRDHSVYPRVIAELVARLGDQGVPA